MKEKEFAIVDIETTGGNASGSRITEIAIIIHNGADIVDRWETLVNPQKEIPLPIFALTGITNEMVHDAPLFDDISEKVFQMLSGRIFVAHNVNFDYSFVRHQLEESGFRWTARKLCTVRAARKISPGLASYSLGNLCRSLDIPIKNRHRAGGDADATAVLLSKLLEWDEGNIIPGMIKKTAQDQRMPPNLPPEDFGQLPEKPGVYYFYNRERKVIYVGKAVNIKKRVASHFSGNKLSLQRQHFLRDIYGISFEVCATELMALILECIEIKNLWPRYNKALKRFEPKYGLYHYEARNGYRYLAVGRVGKFQQCVAVFGGIREAVDMLRDLMSRFEIDPRFCSFGTTDEGLLPGRYERTVLPAAGTHNEKISRVLDELMENKPSFYIIDKGRSAGERSCIWVQDGQIYGMGYLPLDSGVESSEDMKRYLTRYPDNHYIMQLVYSFASKFPGKVRRVKD